MRLRSLLARPVAGAAITTLIALPVLTAIILVWTATSSPTPIDDNWFGPAGSALLTGRWGDIFGDPAVQAGPFELAPFGLAKLLGVTGHVGWTVLLTAYAAVTAFLAALVLRPRFTSDLRSSLLVVPGVLVIAAAGPIATWTLGHPSEALVPLVWVVAGRLALRDRAAAAAVLVALSSGFEVWGVLGAPMVLLAAHPRLVRSAVAGAVALVALWAPFVLAGPFRMFAFSWPVREYSLLHLIEPDATTFPWSFRLLQAGLAIGAGTAVALLVRGRDGAWGPWGITTAVVAGRLVFDPLLAGYYWVPAMIGAVGALVLAARRSDLPAALVATGALLLSTDLGAPILRACGLVVLVVLAAALARLRAARPVTPPRFAPRRAALT